MGAHVSRAVFRVGTVVCKLASIADPSFTPSGDFEVTRGREYFINGEIVFPPGPPRKPDGFYRTVFGPSVATTAVTYCECDDCVRLAMRRMLNVRRPLEPGFEQRLRANQSLFLKQHVDTLLYLSHLYSSHFDDYRGAEEEAEAHHSDTHPKKQLRIAAYSELVTSGGIHTRTMMTRDGKPTMCTYKFKKGERAKVGKYGRMIGDFGCPASLKGFWMTKLLKEAMASNPLYIGGGLIEFCKSARPTELSMVFEKLYDPPGSFYLVIFSDDSCLAYRSGGVVHRVNLDIKSCDMSHTAAMFDALVDLLPEHVRTDGHALVEQCSQPISVRSISHPRLKVVLKPKGPRLYSGSTLTTCINTFAGFCIGIAIAEVATDLNPDLVVLAAQRVGYEVKCEICTDFEGVQFLKHSPVLGIDGLWHPVLNLGAFFNASGNCKGDLPGRGDLRERANAFQAGLIRSMYPKARFRLLDMMLTTAGHHQLSAQMQRSVDEHIGNKVELDDIYPEFRVDEESLYRRYGLSHFEIEELHDLLGNGGFTAHVASTGIAKILAQDYGHGVRTDHREHTFHCESAGL